MEQVKTPWESSMGNIPMHLSYFNGNLYDALAVSANKFPGAIAFDFMGKSTRYKTFLKDIHLCANALVNLGIRAGDRVTIAMPNCPQALTFFYGLNLMGAVANMIHPLSAEGEIEFYLKESQSVALLTLDDFYEKVKPICEKANIKHLIVTSIADALPFPQKIAYRLTKAKKYNTNWEAITWSTFMGLGMKINLAFPHGEGDRTAVILYSGGTTGITKGILLTNGNFNALGQQVAAANPMYRPGDKMLAAMPIFHGF